jgi:hypothetical protein
VLSQSDSPVDQAISDFTEVGIEADYLVITETGLDRRLMNVHAPLRAFLKKYRIHDYEQQGSRRRDQGREAPLKTVTADGILDRRISFHRPKPKPQSGVAHGDPRAWMLVTRCR